MISQHFVSLSQSQSKAFVGYKIVLYENQKGLGMISKTE